MKRPLWRDNLLYMLILAVAIDLLLVFLPSVAWVLMFLPYDPHLIVWDIVYLYRRELPLHVLSIGLALTGFMVASHRLRRYVAFVLSIFAFAFLGLSLTAKPWTEPANFPSPGIVESLLRTREGKILTFHRGSFLVKDNKVVFGGTERAEISAWHIKGFGVALSSGKYFSIEDYFSEIPSRKLINVVKGKLFSVLTLGGAYNRKNYFQMVLAERLTMWAVLVVALLLGLSSSFLISLQLPYQVTGTFSLIIGIASVPLISGEFVSWLWEYFRNGRLPAFLIPVIIISAGALVLVVSASIYYSAVRKWWREKVL